MVRLLKLWVGLFRIAWIDQGDKMITVTIEQRIKLLRTEGAAGDDTAMTTVGINELFAKVRTDGHIQLVVGGFVPEAPDHTATLHV